MAAQSTSADTTAQEEPNFIQSWFQSWMNPCMRATTLNMDLLVDPKDLPKSAATPGKAKDLDLPCPPGPPAKKTGVVGKYKIDISNIGASKRPGVAYRSSKSQAGRLKTSAKWGEVVEGVDEGDGWLRVGGHYLFMTHKGKAVITPLKEEETFSPKAGIPPSPARAASNANSPKALKVEEKVVEEPAQDVKESEEPSAKEDQTAVDQVQECKTADEPPAETEAAKEETVKEEQAAVEQTLEDAIVGDAAAETQDHEETQELAAAEATEEKQMHPQEATQAFVAAEAIKDDQILEERTVDASGDQKDVSEEVKETTLAEEPAPAIQEEAVTTPEEEEDKIVESLCKVPSPVKICQEVCVQEDEAAKVESTFAPVASNVVKADVRSLPDPSTIESPLEKFFVEAILQQRADSSESVAQLEA